jgi:hypothetical protein
MSDHVAGMLLLSGVLLSGYAIAALFFLRFWRDTRDRLFVFFAIAFCLLAIQRAALGWALWSGRETVVYYALRLAAFVLILIGIVDKNRVR